MDFAFFIENLTKNLVGRLPDSQVRQIQRSKESDRFGRDIILSHRELESFRSTFSETFGVEPDLIGPTQVTMGDLHHRVAELV